MKSLPVCSSILLRSLLSGAWLLAACSGSSSSPSQTEGRSTSGPQDSAPIVVDAGSSSAIAFAQSQYALPVLSRTELDVRVSPPIAGAISFALVGASLDASLEAERVELDATGVAHVFLTTASQPTTFSVRASLDRGLEAEAQIDVGDTPSGSVKISTKYAGARQVRQYTFSVYPDQDCTSSGLNQLTTGRVSTTTTSTEATVGGVPLSKSLAVVVEGDEVVRGCSTTRALAGQNSLSIQVALDDLPADFTNAKLTLSLTTNESQQQLADSVEAQIPAFVSQFVPGSHDLIQLLTFMEQAATGSLQQEVSEARKAGDWDPFVVGVYGTSGADLLRAALRRWLDTGVQRLASKPIVVELSLGSTQDTPAQLTLLRIADLDATTQLEGRSTNLAVLAEPADKLSWSTKATLGKSRLYMALAQSVAASEYPQANGLSAQLAELVGCDVLSAQLDGRVGITWTQSNARTCTQACLATLCRSALDLMMKQAQAEANQLGAFEFAFNATGSFAVDQRARPTRASGSWVGAVLGTAQAVSFSGVYESQ